MNQPQRQDERVLDYIYGELGPEERSAFEEQLGKDAALRAEVESLEQVRKTFRGLQKAQQSPESVQRMTALLMQQAAKEHGHGANDGGEKDGAEAREGKVVPFRARGLRRIFASPASGIFAAAAAALFWVVFKSQSPAPAPTLPPTAFLPSQGTAPATPPAAPPIAELPTKNLEQPKAEPAAKDVVAAAADPAKADNAFALNEKAAAPTGDDWNRGSATASPTSSGTSVGAVATAKMGKSRERLPLKEAFDAALSRPMPKSMPKPTPPAKPVYLAQVAPQDLKKAEKADALTERRFAQPPPPMAAEASEGEKQAQDKTSLRAQLAQAKQHRQDRIVEELANQRLGDMPSAGGAHASAPPATSSSLAETGRYAQNQAAPSGQAAAMDDSRAPAQTAAPPADNQLYAANAPPPPPAAAPSPSYMQNSAPQRAVSNTDGDSSGAGLLSSAQDLLRQGRCAEAHGQLQRLEQSFPTLAALPEIRAQWQRTCQTQNALPAVQAAPETQAPPKLLKNYEQDYAPAPASATERSALPQTVANKSAPMRAKKAAKAKPAAADAAK